MTKWKNFVAGALFGAMLTGGAVYAADEVQIPVSFPDIQIAVDGTEVRQSPPTIRYEETNYVPVRFLAEVLGMEAVWDENSATIHLNSVEAVAYEEVEPLSAPRIIAEWVERSRDRKMAQVRHYEGDTYILITRGAKNSGGYAVDIDRVYRNDRGLVVQVSFTDPPKGTPVTEEMTHPLALLRLEQPYNDPIAFKESHGNDMSDLQGLSYLPRVYKETEHILLFEPEKDTEGKIVVSGVARAFEGALLYTLHDEEERLVEQKWLTAEGAAPQWGFFSTEVENAESGWSLTLQVFALEEEVAKDEIVLSLGDWWD